MNKHLCITILPLVEFDVRLWRFIQADMMGNNERRLGDASDDHIPKVAVVSFYIALACAK
jgi:hypothetical protein